MASLFLLKPTHSPVKAYYAALSTFHEHGHNTEGNTRPAFAALLRKCASPYEWHLVEEFPFKGTGKQPLRADGALVDKFTLQHGIWEAKDTGDDLATEIKKKRDKGYPLVNTLFQSPTHAVLYQDNRIAFDEPITSPEKLVEVLKLFFEHQQPDIPDWKDAVTQFSAKIAELATGVNKILTDEHKRNATFRENFQAFADLCRQSINPDLADPAIQNMLVQHLLTERIFRKVFNNNEFLRRNVIAAEIEKVISSITARHFSRDEFLKPLDRFYKSIERAAEAQTEYTEKQHFLNAVYEKFFQNFDAKQADTMGIVYTPQPIVDFMVRSVDEILQQEFGKTLSDKGVHILDPFTGTGNFITRIMQQIKRSALPQKYAEELHCNEIMLLPYYIASMNIEHAYVERAGEYRPFEGLCLVDTFELAEPKQATLSFMTEDNTTRIKRQKESPIFVVIANPPYNVGQQNENDNNKNRKYPELDRRVNQSYAKASTATNKNALSDPYVKAIRWASDRIGQEGIVAFVSNNSFLDDVSFDGMRKHLVQDFSTIYHFNLKGNARTAGERRRQEGGNIFLDQIRVSVGITFFVRGRQPHSKIPEVWIHSVADYLGSGAKTAILQESGSYAGVNWHKARIDRRGSWVIGDSHDDFDGLLPLGVKKRGRAKGEVEAVFEVFSNGNDSGRDNWVYNFAKDDLIKNVGQFADTYNSEVDRYKRAGCPKNVDKFVISDGRKIKWTRNSKRDLRRGKYVEFAPEKVQIAMYHPFSTQWLYPGRIYNKEVAHFPRIFPTLASQRENQLISVPGAGNRKGFGTLGTNLIPTLDVAFEKIQCFPFYIYDEEGEHRRENITDWALAEFRTHYSDKKITKWDIFHATYAILHHPEYRTRYAANLKRELPRIPFPPDFHAFAAAGKHLMELHIDYEKQKEYPLEQIEDPKAEVSFRVERMKLSKDKSELRYNDFLTLRGIPAAAFDYRLGNRSALEWVIDQYQVSTDKRSGIVNDPNRDDAPQYILRLIGQVITVSLETQQIIAGLPSLNLPA